MKKGQMAAAKTQGRGALLVLSLVCVGLLVAGGVFFAQWQSSSSRAQKQGGVMVEEFRAKMEEAGSCASAWLAGEGIAAYRTVSALLSALKTRPSAGGGGGAVRNGRRPLSSFFLPDGRNLDSIGRARCAHGTGGKARAAGRAG